MSATPSRSCQRSVDGFHPLADRERRPKGSLGVVLVAQRRPEDGEDRVADELLDEALVLVDDLGQLVEQVVLELPDELGIEPLAERREPGQVGEQHRDVPTLRLAGRRRS